MPPSGRERGAEREHLGAVAQPAVDVRLHDRHTAPGPEPLAVGRCARNAARGGGSPGGSGRGPGTASAHDSARADRGPASTLKPAAPQPLDLAPPHPSAGEAQDVARSDVRGPLRLGRAPGTRPAPPLCASLRVARRRPGPHRGGAVVIHAPHVAGGPAEERPVFVGDVAVFRHCCPEDDRRPESPCRRPAGFYRIEPPLSVSRGQSPRTTSPVRRRIAPGEPPETCAARAGTIPCTQTAISANVRNSIA